MTTVSSSTFALGIMCTGLILIVGLSAFSPQLSPTQNSSLTTSSSALPAVATAQGSSTHTSTIITTASSSTGSGRPVPAASSSSSSSSSSPSSASSSQSTSSSAGSASLSSDNNNSSSETVSTTLLTEQSTPDISTSQSTDNQTSELPCAVLVSNNSSEGLNLQTYLSSSVKMGDSDCIKAVLTNDNQTAISSISGSLTITNLEGKVVFESSLVPFEAGSLKLSEGNHLSFQFLWNTTETYQGTTPQGGTYLVTVVVQFNGMQSFTRIENSANITLSQA